MITVSRIAPFGLFYYWEKSVSGGLDRFCLNHRFIVMIGQQARFVLSLESYVNGLQTENNRLITDLHTTGIIQIPIVFQHTASPCLRPAVSSLGACPTPAR